MAGVDQVVAAALAEVTGRVVVGFSGGVDSTVLLHAAACRADVTAVHVHHGLHPDADAWQAHCAAVCDAWGVTLHAVPVSVPRHGNLEAQARAARYRVFTGLMRRAGDRLLLAHHLDDQAETGLLRLLQGRGLYGMPSSRPIGAGRLLRPLLALPRAELTAYAAVHGLSWIEDPSNADLRFDRNFVRHRLMPALRARWPGVDGAIVGALASPQVSHLAALDALPVNGLEDLPPEQAVTVLREWLARHGLPAPRRAALADFLAQLGAPEDRQPCLAIGKVALHRHRGHVHVVRRLPPLADSYPLAAPGNLMLPHGELRVVPDPDGWRPRGALTVRFRRGGERLRWRGRSRALKQLLQASHMPPWQRDALPLIYDQAGLLAVPGVAWRDDGAGPGFRAQWLARGEFL